MRVEPDLAVSSSLWRLGGTTGTWHVQEADGKAPPFNEEGASWRSVLVVAERFGFWHYRKSLNQHQNVLKGAPRLSHVQGLFPDLPGEQPRSHRLQCSCFCFVLCVCPSGLSSCVVFWKGNSRCRKSARWWELPQGWQRWCGWKAGQVGAEGRVFDETRWTWWLLSSSITDSAVVVDERRKVQEKCVREESLGGLSCVKWGWVRLWLEH